ncbi:MAG: VOC family protein [Micromonosporaceae bacterium]|nr:VOC family protein [Micromonosporaceae bacterium]
MTVRLHAVRFDANDPTRLAEFWAGVLRREIAEDGITLLPGTATDLAIRFDRTATAKTGLGRAHLDLTSGSAANQNEIVQRALDLGGRHLDISQTPDDQHVVLADPEGNEFCVIEPGNKFLAGCGAVGAFNWDGSQQVGYFWSRALHWPLVWDQDEQTAIQSPEGGMKIAWGGPPVRPASTNDRLHMELEADTGAEVDRLITLGATRVGHEDAEAVLADPDGNQFRLRRR